MNNLAPVMPESLWVGRSIMEMHLVDGVVVLELDNGAQLQFRVHNGEIEVGLHREERH